jgi:hypothetical protein
MSVIRRRAAVTLAVAATAGLAAVASAATRHPATTVVKAAHNSHQNKQIVVDAHGNTLYRLTGDTPGHLEAPDGAVLLDLGDQGGIRRIGRAHAPTPRPKQLPGRAARDAAVHLRGRLASGRRQRRRNP